MDEIPTKEPREFTIKRSKWIRGEGPGKSFLRREEDKKMCCLGFLCVAAGSSKNNILGLKSPEDLDVELPSSLEWLVDIYEKIEGLVDEKIYEDKVYTQNLMVINDREDISEETREAQLTDMFLENGWKPVFVD